MRLSRRERQLVEGILQGGSEASIADALGISRSTVHTYVGRVYRKLNVNDRSGLVARVFEEYLILQRSNGVTLSLNDAATHDRSDGIMLPVR